MVNILNLLKKSRKLNIIDKKRGKNAKYISRNKIYNEKI